MPKVKKSYEAPASFWADKEKEGFVRQDRNVTLSKWGLGETVEGVFLGFKPGKKFSGKDAPSTLIRFKEDGKTKVYAAPAVLFGIFEDVVPGTECVVVCLGQTMKVKDRKELAWDFDVALKS